MESDTAVSPPEAGPEDRLLLRELLADGRLSHRELSRRTGLSLATVNRRIRKMEREGAIQGYTVRIHPEAAGWGMTVIVGLRIEKGHLREVQEAIVEDARIVGVYDVTGEWDGFAVARVRDRADLDDLAKTTLSLDHILRTNTMVVLHTVGEHAIVPLPPEPA